MLGLVLKATGVDCFHILVVGFLYMMVSDEIIGIRYFKHLVDTHGYTTPEQLLADHKREREENEKRINSPEYKAKEEEYMRKATEKFISDNI